MKFKQLLRKLFAELWHRCGRLAEEKISRCGAYDEKHAEWWEAFILRCEKHALRHAEFVPNEQQQESPAPYVPAVQRRLDGLTCVEWVKNYRNEKHCSLKEAKDEWDRRIDGGTNAASSQE